MGHLKTITQPVIEGALSMPKKGIDKHINKIPDSPSSLWYTKICTLGNCSYSEESTINVTGKTTPQSGCKITT